MKKNREAKGLNVSNSRWLAYAAAGAASALVGAPHSEAEIHYSGPVGKNLFGIRHTSLALSNGASLVFNIFDGGSSYPIASFFIQGAATASARVYDPGFTFAGLSRLRSGVNVSSGTFGSVGGMPGHGELRGLYNSGRFNSSGKGIIGFRFNTGNGIQYGWARVTVNTGAFFFKVRYRYKVQDYAWGDPGDSIRAGQTSSSGHMVDAIPDSGSLGLLALGAAGVQVWRESRPQEPR